MKFEGNLQTCETHCCLKLTLLLAPVAKQIGNYYSGRCSHDNFFVKRDTIWHICFKETFVTIPDQRGLCYIAHLVDTPNEFISAHELMFVCGLIDSPMTDKGKKNKKPIAPYIEGVYISDHGIDDLTDAQSIRKIKARVDYLKEKLKARIKRNSNADIRDIEDELMSIKDYIKESTGKGGKPRKVGDSYAKWTNTVYQAIKRSIGQIHRYHSVLANHLDESIERKNDFRYRTAEHILWIVET